MSSARATSVVLALCVWALGASAQPSVLPFVGSEDGQDAILDRIEHGVPRRFRQVGTTSVTMRIDFVGDTSAAFKPRTHTHSRGYASEIAAYRIARALGMDNVPPVIGRRLPRPLVQERFVSDHPEDWEAIRQEILWDAPGTVRGAAVYWIPSMQRTELDTAAGIEPVRGWLTVEGEVPEESWELARDLSCMFAFDYLIGNWDRLSGGNVTTDDAGRRLFIRDHNVGFVEPLTDVRYERVRQGLERTQRFSRGFVAGLRALNEGALRASLSTDPLAADGPLLNEAQIAGLLSRRRAILSYVGALVALHGAERVLPWP